MVPLFITLFFGVFVEGKELASPEARKRYYTLFREVDYQRKWAALHTFWWLMRRLLTVVIMQVDLFSARLLLLLALQVVVICSKKFYTDRGLYWLEIANELFLCLFLYLLAAFNDSRLDTCYVGKAGWIFVGLIVLQAFVNAAFVLWMSVLRRTRPGTVTVTEKKEPEKTVIRLRTPQKI